MGETFHCIIMGAAGRDFHDMQTFFAHHPEFRVCAFTATQIPYIESRTFPRSLAGASYDEDIPIYPESQLPELIKRFGIDFVFLAYSDLAHADVMHKASLVQSCGASFALLGPRHTQLESRHPVIGVTAVRTGAGKSPITLWLAKYLVSLGVQVGVIRHPMPYGQLSRQRVERFDSRDDLDRYACTVEEREEYEPYLEEGLPVFAGVDYRRVLEAAEEEAHVILWDGGNNDFAFLRTDLSIVVADALRPGHEVSYYPGETNLRMAGVVVINKVAQARADDIASIRWHVEQLNPSAEVVEADLEIDVDDPKSIADSRVLVVEDGPTLTHGGMAYGAGTLAARKFGAGELVDPHAAAVGSIAEVLRGYPHLGAVLPALGYAPEQCLDLQRTIEASGAEVVVDASPARVDQVLELTIPVVRVRYHFRQTAGTPLADIVDRFLHPLRESFGKAPHGPRSGEKS